MRVIKNKWHVIVLIIISLTPIIWFWGKGNVLITGLDTNFPLDPSIWLGRRFFVWNSLVNAGQDFSSSVAGIFFHTIQVIPFLGGLNLVQVEIFSLIFWFTCVVFSSLIFIKSIIPRNKMAQLIFVVLYSFNIYLFNTWENIKVSNLAFVVGLPLMLAILITFKNGKISVLRTAVYSVLVGFLVSGSGINPAYFTSMILGVSIYFLVAFFDIEQSSQRKIFIKGFVVFLLSTLLVNLFWVLPLFNFLFISKPAIGILDLGFTNWLDSLSENTSLDNVIRFQGAWDWYAKNEAGVPLYIPYSVNYFYKFPFILFSFSLFAFSLLSLIFNQKAKKHFYVFFAVLSLLGIFLGAGSHLPTGAIYNFFIRHIPSLSFFRSPWYIFTPLLIISLSSLAALFYEFLDQKTKMGVFRIGLTFIACVFIVGHLLYSYPLITGKIYRPAKSDRFYVNFPDYVWETRSWLESRDQTKRIVTYPDDQLESFDWGYRGTDSIIGLFSNQEFISPSFNFSNKGLNRLLEQFYLHAKRSEFESSLEILKFFGANAIFEKKDALSLSPKFNSKIDQLTNKTSFGPWNFYEISDDKTTKKLFSPLYLYSDSDIDAFALSSPLLMNKSVRVDMYDSEVVKVSILKNSSQIILATNKAEWNDLSFPNQTYFAEILTPGNYRVALEKRNLEADGISIFLDENKLEGAIEEDSFLVWDVFMPKAGKHKIEILFPESVNLTQELDFSEYQVQEDLREEEKPSDPSRTLIAFNNEGVVKTIQIPVDKFDPLEKYVFSYDYKYFYGSVPFIDVIQYNPKTPLRGISLYPGSSSDWQKNIGLLDLVPVVGSKLEIRVRMPEKDGGRSKAYFENISLKPAYDNKLIFIQKEQILADSPQVSFEKISPVKYKVVVDQIKDNYILAFLENFDKGWKIKSQQDIKSPVHFSINGYANAWYIPATNTKHEIELYYFPQRYFIIGFGASTAMLLLALLMLVIRRKKI